MSSVYSCIVYAKTLSLLLIAVQETLLGLARMWSSPDFDMHDALVRSALLATCDQSSSVCLMNTPISNVPVDGGGASIGPVPASVYPMAL